MGALSRFAAEHDQAVEHERESGRLIQSIQNWIHRMAGLDPLQKKSLSNFFSSTIAFDPKHRQLDLQEAMKEFAQFV